MPEASRVVSPARRWRAVLAIVRASPMSAKPVATGTSRIRGDQIERHDGPDERGGDGRLKQP